jgi:lambda family phage portal protein
MAAVTPVSPILDASGRPMQRAEIRDTSHTGASYRSAEMSGWHPGLKSADSSYLYERDTLVARVRDLIRNDGWAAGTVQRLLDSIIGCGLRLKAKPNWQVLKQDPEWASDWSRDVEAKFRAWAYDPRNFIDATRQTNFGGLMGLGMRHRIGDGEVLIIPKWLDRPGSKFKLALEIVDPDRLANPNGAPDSDRLRGGVELDENGARVALHIRVGHPYDMGFVSANSWQTVRIPMETPWGRPMAIHHFEGDQASQHRGVSMFAPVLQRLRMAQQYDRIEMQAAVINASLTAFVESSMDRGFVEEMLDGPSEGLSNYQEGRAGYYGEVPIRMDGARVVHTYPGDKVEIPQSNRPHSGHEPFLRLAHRNLASATGLSYPQVSGDYSGLNYSTMRAAFIDVHRFVDARRFYYAAGTASPIYMMWLEEAIDNGTVDLPPGAPDFYEAAASYAQCEWLGPGRGVIDPTKEAQAAQMRVEGQQSSATREAALQGQDYEDILDDQVAEAKLRQERNLPPPPLSNGQNGPIHASDMEQQGTPR